MLSFNIKTGIKCGNQTDFTQFSCKINLVLTISTIILILITN
jgi:hypothetical protein